MQSCLFLYTKYINVFSLVRTNGVQRKVSRIPEEMSVLNPRRPLPKHSCVNSSGAPRSAPQLVRQQPATASARKYEKFNR